jgi:deoxyhypusine synthase
MVFGEATITFPLVAGYAYHAQNWKQRTEKRFNRLFAKAIESELSGR